MRYRQIDHTADFGVLIFGENLFDLFENAGYTLFDILLETETSKKAKQKVVRINGSDMPDLMVNWLRELLYFWTRYELFVTSINIMELSENHLTAQIDFGRYDEDFHEIKQEIKAVTYHQIKIARKETCWESRIIFDI